MVKVPCAHFVSGLAHNPAWVSQGSKVLVAAAQDKATQPAAKGQRMAGNVVHFHLARPLRQSSMLDRETMHGAAMLQETPVGSGFRMPLVHSVSQAVGEHLPQTTLLATNQVRVPKSMGEPAHFHRHVKDTCCCWNCATSRGTPALQSLLTRQVLGWMPEGDVQRA